MLKYTIMRPLFFLVFCLPFMAQAQVNQDSVAIKKMADEIMTNGTAYDLLRELTKKIGGRLAGSPQQQNAAIWGKRNLEAMKPDKVYMQPCKTPNWQRGGRDFSAVVAADGKPMMDKLEVFALGNSLSSNGLVEAELLAVANFDELEKRKDEILKLNNLKSPFENRLELTSLVVSMQVTPFKELSLVVSV